VSAFWIAFCWALVDAGLPGTDAGSWTFVRLGSDPSGNHEW